MDLIRGSDYLVMNLRGDVEESGGSLSNTQGKIVSKNILKLLQDAALFMKLSEDGGSLRRITLNSKKFGSYRITIADSKILVLKKESN